MADKVGVDQLADAIVRAMKEYTDAVAEGVAEVVDETAQECRDEIEENSPEQSGEYKKGWTIVKENGRGFTKRIIWNENYRLPHLLEHGHAKQGGGRVPGKPHIAPAEKKYTETLFERIEDVVRKGGK